MKRTIRILSWNVNGIRAAHKKGFLDWLDSSSADIVCIQETKATPEQLSSELREPAAYASYWHSADKKGYSGVAVYSREKPLQVETGLGVPRFDQEGRLIALKFPQFTLLNVYFPNGKQNEERLRFKLDFYDTFLEFVEGIRKKDPRLIFVGDVNTAHREIDLARPKENEKVSGFLPVERAWIDRAISVGYVDTFRSANPEAVQYSWWDLKSRARERNVGWRIDYVFVARELHPRVKSAFILPEIMGSDHCPIGIDLEVD